MHQSWREDQTDTGFSLWQRADMRLANALQDFQHVKGFNNTCHFKTWTDYTELKTEKKHVHWFSSSNYFFQQISIQYEKTGQQSPFLQETTNKKVTSIISCFLNPAANCLKYPPLVVYQTSPSCLITQLWSLSVLNYTESLCGLITEYSQFHVYQHTEKPAKFHWFYKLKTFPRCC